MTTSTISPLHPLVRPRRRPASTTDPAHRSRPAPDARDRARRRHLSAVTAATSSGPAGVRLTRVAVAPLGGITALPRPFPAPAATAWLT